MQQQTRTGGDTAQHHVAAGAGRAAALFCSDSALGWLQMDTQGSIFCYHTLRVADGAMARATRRMIASPTRDACIGPLGDTSSGRQSTFIGASDGISAGATTGECMLLASQQAQQQIRAVDTGAAAGAVERARAAMRSGSYWQMQVGVGSSAPPHSLKHAHVVQCCE
jgi:hypothetical protein